MTTHAERRIRIGDSLVPYDDAAQDVEIKRTNADILSAVPGDDRNCMNSRCIKAQRNSRVFPHPVYAVSTIKSRVYIVDKITESGEFSHAIRYELTSRDSRLISEHDSQGVGEPGLLTLRVPSDPKGSPKRQASGGGYADVGGSEAGPHTYSGKSNRPVNLGAAARFKVAVGALNL